MLSSFSTTMDSMNPQCERALSLLWMTKWWRQKERERKEKGKRGRKEKGKRKERERNLREGKRKERCRYEVQQVRMTSISNYLHRHPGLLQGPEWDFKARVRTRPRGRHSGRSGILCGFHSKRQAGVLLHLFFSPLWAIHVRSLPLIRSVPSPG